MANQSKLTSNMQLTDKQLYTDFPGLVINTEQLANKFNCVLASVVSWDPIRYAYELQQGSVKALQVDPSTPLNILANRWCAFWQSRGAGDLPQALYSSYGYAN